MVASPELLRRILRGLEPESRTPQDYTGYVDWVFRVERVEGRTIHMARPPRMDVRRISKKRSVARASGDERRHDRCRSDLSPRTFARVFPPFAVWPPMTVESEGP